MQGSVWNSVLRRIPANFHDTLALGLVTGDEVVVQHLIRLDEDFVIVRGRLAGNTAEGRILVVPFPQMTYVALNRRISETEVQEIFSSGVPAEMVFSAPAPVSVAHDVGSSPDLAIPASAALPQAGPGNGAEPPKAPPSKSILLARLRERLAERSK